MLSRLAMMAAWVFLVIERQMWVWANTMYVYALAQEIAAAMHQIPIKQKPHKACGFLSCGL